MSPKIDRRLFLLNSFKGVTGLILAARMSAADVVSGTQLEAESPFLWLAISSDNHTTVFVVKNEMGQAISTAFAQIVAEELEADWRTIRVELLPAVGPRGSEGFEAATQGSESVQTRYDLLRTAGAAAREMLLTACASRWGVDVATLTARDSMVFHPGGSTVTYGELAEEASRLPIPTEPVLKDRADFTKIGRALHRLDTWDHIQGSTVYGIDFRVPGMLYAAVRQAPSIVGAVMNFTSLSVEGTGAEAIVSIPNGIAVAASSWWTAKRVIEDLEVEFFSLPWAAELSTEGISQELADGLQELGPMDPITGAETVVEAEYTVPLLAHAAMEPLACTAHVTAGACEVWAPTQYAAGVLDTAMRITGLPSTAVTVHTLPLGGGFGRKLEADFVEQAIRVSQAVGRPVKVIWTREEDIRHDFYRSASHTKLAAGLDAEGTLTGWVGRCAAKSILGDCSSSGPDGSCWDLWGFDGSLPYRIPDLSVQFQNVDYHVRNGWMRGVGYSRNTFSVESFIDELAQAAAMDPVDFRLGNLENQRVHTTLQRVAELASWGSPAAAGAAHGVALMEHRGTSVAAVAEVSLGPGGRVIVHRFYVAIDCGQVVNPDIVRAQMEGGVVFGMSTGLFGEITFREGAVVQSNFHDYPLLTLRDSPEVVVTIVDSAESPSGVGEHAVGVVPPAVTNALFRLTGERIRSLPISSHV